MIFKRGHSKEGGKISVILRRKEAKAVQEGEREKQGEARRWLAGVLSEGSAQAAVLGRTMLTSVQVWSEWGWEQARGVGNTLVVQRFCWALAAPSPPRWGPWSQLLWSLDLQVLLAWPETPALLLCVLLSVHGPSLGAEPRPSSLSLAVLFLHHFPAHSDIGSSWEPSPAPGFSFSSPEREVRRQWSSSWGRAAEGRNVKPHTGCPGSPAARKWRALPLANPGPWESNSSLLESFLESCCC